MAKQSYIVPGLIILVLIYNFFTLPMQTNALSVLATFAIYGLTGSPILTFFTLLATPIIVFALPKKEGFHNDGAAQISERVKKIRSSKGTAGPKGPTGVLGSPGIENFMNLSSSFKRGSDMFQDASGNREDFQDASGNGEEDFQDASGNKEEDFQDASGNGEEDFQDASGNRSNFQDANALEERGAPGVSIPAFVRQQGRMLVVPEFSVPRNTSVDRAPKANPYVPQHDEEGIESALASDATRLPAPQEPARNRPGMSAGAPRVLGH